MVRYALLTATFALAACASTAGYEKTLNTWVGSQEIELVRSWGPPTRTYEVGAIRFISYMSSGTMHIPGTAPTYKSTASGGVVTTTATGGSSGVTASVYCEVTFELSQSKIVKYTYKGNNCTA